MPRQPLSRSFRIVCDPSLVNSVEELLKAEDYVFEPEPFSCLCRRLVYEPKPLGSSLAAFFGYIYIQDRSSMLPPLALNPGMGSSVLDMCASPGSKTGFLAQLAGSCGFVLANEPNPARLGTLRANLLRTNLLQTATCSYGGEELPLAAGSFQFILLDPPCSGWGTALKHPKTLQLWQDGKTGPLISLQRALIRQAAKLLAPGGRLLYSTCTTNPAENQAQTSFAIGELGLQPCPLPDFSGFVFDDTGDSTGALLVNGEASLAQGFYLSLLRKEGHSSSVSSPTVQEKFFPANIMEKAGLDSQVFNSASLPPGFVADFGGKLRFIAAPATQLVPAGFAWQAPLLGDLKMDHAKTVFMPNSRLRCLLPQPVGPRSSAIIFDTLEPVRRLLSGTNISTECTEPFVGLWWRDLPLGICRVRNGRLLAKF